MTNTSGCCYTL